MKTWQVEMLDSFHCVVRNMVYPSTGSMAYRQREREEPRKSTAQFPYLKYVLADFLSMKISHECTQCEY